VIQAAAGGLVLLALLQFTPAVTRAAADPTRGERVFQRCYACHSVAPGEDRLQGPSLRCVLGRRAGTLAGFTFSPAMVEAGTARTLVWTRATLDAFLVDPQSVVPGTAMWIPSLAVAEDRRDVIDYLERAGPCPAETLPPAVRP
jgi:cytochrome c